jgi:hypothetical protein
MVTPLQIDSYTRDLWGEFDPLAIAELSPVAYDSCYRPKIIVGLDSEAQTVPGDGYSQAVIKIVPGSLIVGFLFGNNYLNSGDEESSSASSGEFNIQITDLELNHQFFSEPVSQGFLANVQGVATQFTDNVNYPNLLSSPYPVTGKGRFLFEVWNQQDAAQVIIPLLITLEPK